MKVLIPLYYIKKSTMKKIIIKKSRDGQFYFILKARNGETIHTSEMYKRKAGAKKGIAALAKFFYADMSNYIITDKTKL
jgi:uncharacterized protein YegP (UPF0339 family)